MPPVKPVVDPHALGAQQGCPKVLFMRHPQTEANSAHVYLGRGSAPLTALGERQAREASAALAAWAPDRIVSSPLERCRSIACPAAALRGIQAEVDLRAIEIDFGVLQGKTVEQARREGLPLPWDGDGRWPCPGGEDLSSVVARVGDLCGELACCGSDVAVVTHGGVIRCVFAAVLGVDAAHVWQLDVRNVSSAVFSAQDGRLYLEAFGLAPAELAARAAR